MAGTPGCRTKAALQMNKAGGATFTLVAGGCELLKMLVPREIDAIWCHDSCPSWGYQATIRHLQRVYNVRDHTGGDGDCQLISMDSECNLQAGWEYETYVIDTLAMQLFSFISKNLSVPPSYKLDFDPNDPNYLWSAYDHHKPNG